MLKRILLWNEKFTEYFPTKENKFLYQKKKKNSDNTKQQRKNIFIFSDKPFLNERNRNKKRAKYIGK